MMNLNRARFHAKRIEDAQREKAFLPVLDEINRVCVKQLTSGHLETLFAISSPFVYGGIRQIEDVGAFLWIVSPHYDANNPPVELKWLWRLYYRLRRQPIPTLREAFMLELVQHPRWHLFYRAIDRYIYFATMDRPPSVEGSKAIETCFTAAIAHRLRKAYGGLSMEEIRNTPISANFQFLKRISADQNPKEPQFRPLQSRVEATAERIKESRLRRGNSESIRERAGAQREGLRHGG